MTRFAPRFAAALLCATALTACASTPDAPSQSGDAAQTREAFLTKPGADLETNIRQAQLLRHDGRYDDAIRILSQLMMVATDDPRVVSEYGKTLAQKGRAQDAIQFLSRATELSPNDWTLYSALGVSYDQLNDHAKARNVYERALALRPGEASVLNNYALSRMLAKDPEGAQVLIGRAEIAGGGGNEKIARNIAMMKAMAPEKTVAEKEVSKALAYAVQKPAPSPTASPAPKPAAVPAARQNNPAPAAMARNNAPAPAVKMPPLPPLPQPSLAQQQQTFIAAGPRNLQPQAPVPAPALPYVSSPTGVVMQRVPEDPLAGPVKPRRTAAAVKKPARDAMAEAAAADAALMAEANKQPKSAMKMAAKKENVPALRLAADAY